MLLLQEFCCEIRDRKGYENPIVDHLFRIVYTRGIKAPISECFADEQLFTVYYDPWYTDVVNHLVTGKLLEAWNKHDRDRFLHFMKFYIWDYPYLNTSLIKLLGDVS